MGIAGAIMWLVGGVVYLPGPQNLRVESTAQVRS